MPRKPIIPATGYGLGHRVEGRQRERPRDQVLDADDPRLPRKLEIHPIESESENVDLRKSNNAVALALERYPDLHDFAPVGLFTLAANGAIRNVNTTGATLVGIERSRLAGRSLKQLISVELRPVFSSFLKHVFASQVKQSSDFELLSKGPPPRTVQIDAHRSLERQECYVVMVDITERKREKDKMRISEIRYRRLFEAAHDGVLLLDPITSKITDANPFMTKLLGYSRDQLVGKDFIEIGLLKDEAAKESYEWQIQRVILPGGEYGVVCFFTNIMERKRSEEAQRRLEVLSASNRKLELEIVRRQLVQESLKKSEQHQSLLLEQSRHLQEQLRSLSHQILHAHEEERNRISRDLHDEIAQSLVGINVRLAALAREAAASPIGLQQKIAHTQQSVEKSVEKVHQFARQLRPALLDDLGLIPALHGFMKSFTEQTGVRTELTAFAAVERSDTAKRTGLFRVAQEALTNVARHAQASRVEVIIQKMPEGICMKVKDDGKSFKVDRVLRKKGSKHLGLLGMRERLEMVGGGFEVESVPGKGTTITARIPSSPPARGGH